MTLETFGWAVFIAVAFVAWPNLSKALGVSGQLVAFVIIVVAAVVVLVTSHNEILTKLPTMNVKAVVWVVIVGVANALAIYIYAKIAADESVPTGIFLVTVFILEVVIAPFIDWIINGTGLTYKQWFGLTLAIPSLWLLAKV